MFLVYFCLLLYLSLLFFPHTLLRQLKTCSKSLLWDFFLRPSRFFDFHLQRSVNVNFFSSSGCSSCLKRLFPTDLQQKGFLMNKGILSIASLFVTLRSAGQKTGRIKGKLEALTSECSLSKLSNLVILCDKNTGCDHALWQKRGCIIFLRLHLYLVTYWLFFNSQYQISY